MSNHIFDGSSRDPVNALASRGVIRRGDSKGALVASMERSDLAVSPVNFGARKRRRRNTPTERDVIRMRIVTGAVFGKLRLVSRREDHPQLWDCICACGTGAVVGECQLVDGTDACKKCKRNK